MELCGKAEDALLFPANWEEERRSRSISPAWKIRCGSKPVPAAIPEAAQGVETILLVEDDDAVRRMTREFLRIKGYTVIEAPRAADAIQLMQLHQEEIDLVLTDVLMPGMKGRELVERLVEMRAGIKVLYMSAYTEDAAINIGVLNPGTEFIEKPFGPDELASKVRQVLRRTSTIRS